MAQQPLHPDDIKHLDELRKSGNYDKEFVELLKRQYDRGLVLYPVILDAEGRVVCGWHRLLASQDWPRVKLDSIKHGDALKYELLHHTAREGRLTESVNKMAAEMKKENPSLTVSQIAEKFHQEFGYNKSHLIKIIKTVPKLKTRPPKTVKTGRVTITLPEVLLKWVRTEAERQNVRVSELIARLVIKVLLGDFLKSEWSFLFGNANVPLETMQKVVKGLVEPDIPNIGENDINDIIVALVKGGILKETKVNGQIPPCFQLNDIRDGHFSLKHA
jgi:hypothetical protein